MNWTPGEEETKGNLPNWENRLNDCWGNLENWKADSRCGGQVQVEADWTNLGFILVGRSGVLTKEVDGLKMEDWETRRAAFCPFTNGKELKRLGEIIAKSSRSSRSSRSSISLLSSLTKIMSPVPCPEVETDPTLDGLTGTRLTTFCLGWKLTCRPDKSAVTICKSSSSKTKTY